MKNGNKIHNCVAIHQPNFLPWLGFFAKLVYAEKFILLDDVYFSKRKHIDRVQIINSQGEAQWIGLNVGENYRINCNDIIVKDTSVVYKIIKTLQHSYSKAKYYHENIHGIEQILTESVKNSNRLVDIDIYIIEGISKILNLAIPKIVLSSSFENIETYDATERLIKLCHEIHCSKIIVGSKAGTEVHDVGKIYQSGISIILQDYLNKHPKYPQSRRKYLGFLKGLSVVDSIFNNGINQTREFLFLKPEHYHDRSQSFKNF